MAVRFDFLMEESVVGSGAFGDILIDIAAYDADKGADNNSTQAGNAKNRKKGIEIVAPVTGEKIVNEEVDFIFPERAGFDGE